VLYAQNCAACHGADGLKGPSTPLASPVYQTLVDDATLVRVVSQGRPGTMMPAFSRSSGGDLTDQQVNAIVRGMRDDWRHGDSGAGEDPPPYADDGKGNSAAGQRVYATVCARCHGAAGGKIGPSGSVLDPAVLALLSPQALRTTVIVGRPDLGMPDWRDQVKGSPLTAQQVSDVVAFLVAQKPDAASPPERVTGPEAKQGHAHQQEMSGGVR
jgi:cytochrome c oxidase cbb3-type subunit 3/ubiquinol-cytochrome c reductase cytochrome c subunit